MTQSECSDEKLAKTLAFLKETSAGKYSRIDPESLKYIRIKEITDVETEIYYYSVS